MVLRGSAARSLLRVDICLYINTFLAPLACPELLHRVVEGGPVTYPFFNGFYANDFVARFRKSCIRRTRCGLAKSLLPVDLCLHVNRFLPANEGRLREGGPVTYPFFNGLCVDGFLIPWRMLAAKEAYASSMVRRNREDVFMWQRVSRGFAPGFGKRIRRRQVSRRQEVGESVAEGASFVQHCADSCAGSEVQVPLKHRGEAKQHPRRHWECMSWQERVVRAEEVSLGVAGLHAGGVSAKLDGHMYWRMLAAADPAVFAHSLALLTRRRARLVGGVRRALPRFSPGCGVRRRRRHSSGTCSVQRVGESKCATEVLSVVPAGALAGALGSTCHCFDGFRRKCLQRAVLALLGSGSEGNVMERMLLATCRNDAPSGGFGSKAAQGNL